MRSPVGRNSRGRVARYYAKMPRIIRHEPVPQSGSYEVGSQTAGNPNSFISTMLEHKTSVTDRTEDGR